MKQALFEWDEIAQRKLDELRSRAESKIFSIEFMKAREKNPNIPAPGDDARFKCSLNYGFKVVYTLETHRMKGTEEPIVLRHLSVSGPNKGRLPTLQVMQIIMDELGFKGKIEDPDFSPLHVYIEGEIAINVLEEFTP